MLTTIPFSKALGMEVVATGEMAVSLNILADGARGAGEPTSFSSVCEHIFLLVVAKFRVL